MKKVVYRNSTLAKGSTALELWQTWDKEKDSALRKAYRAKLDKHMKDVEARYKELTQ